MSSPLALGLQPLAFQPTTALAVPGVSANPYGVHAMPMAPLAAAPQPSAHHGVAALASAGGARVAVAVKGALKELGFYNGPVDASQGDDYRRSVLAFQRDHGLRPTGQANAGTRRAIRTALVDKTQQPAGAVAPAGAVGLQATGMPVDTATLGATAPLLAGAPGVPGIIDPATEVGAGFAPAPQSNGPQVNRTQQMGLGTTAQGASQTVTNANDYNSTNRSPYGAWGTPWGAGQGGFPYANMTSAYGYPYVGGTTPGVGGGISGFFRGLLGA